MATTYAGRHGTSARASRTARQRLAVLAVAALAVVLLAAAAWLLTGGRWYVVATPSMGQDAPVGTLLWVRPVEPAALHVGDFITFHPPGSASTFSHRILSITPAGIRTKGTITAPDPWLLRPTDVIGRVTMRWWAIGWLVRALPILVIGALLTVLARRFARGDWRAALTSFGAAATVCAVLVLQRPLTGAVLVDSGFAGGRGHATYVSTGLLPVRIGAPGVAAVELVPGAEGTVVAAASGRFQVSAEPDLPWWLFVLVVTLGLLPGAYSMRARGAAAREPGEGLRAAA